MIHPNVHLEGRTRIGSGCEIHSGVRIVDSTIDDGVVINNFCVIAEFERGEGAQVGPFAHDPPGHPTSAKTPTSAISSS